MLYPPKPLKLIDTLLYLRKQMEFWSPWFWNIKKTCVNDRHHLVSWDHITYYIFVHSRLKRGNQTFSGNVPEKDCWRVNRIAWVKTLVVDLLYSICSKRFAGGRFFLCLQRSFVDPVLALYWLGFSLAYPCPHDRITDDSKLRYLGYLSRWFLSQSVAWRSWWQM